MNNRWISGRLLALSATVVLWASAFPAIRVGLPGLGVAGLSLLRLAVASAAVAVGARVLRVRLPRPRDLPLIVVCGASGMSVYQLLLNWGEVHVPAGPASLLVVTAPVFSVVLARAFLGERLGSGVAPGSLLALAGAAVIALAGGSHDLPAGASVVLAAAAAQGTYHAATKPLLARYTGLEVACYAMWSGTLLLLPLAPGAWRALRTAPGPALASAVYLGLLPSAVGFVTWGYAVARMSVARATAALYLVPAVTIAVAFVWLGEVPRPVELVGGLISLAGVVIINRRAPARSSSTADPVPVDARAPAGTQTPGNG